MKSFWKRRKIVGGLLGPLVLLAVVVPANAYPRPGITARVSVASDGPEANSHSLGPSVSADGRYVAFSSTASNLVPGDTNGKFDHDVFVYDRVAEATERVSLASDGAQANGSSAVADISPDARHVAFLSSATNLVPGDTNGIVDVFVHDRATGATERVSVASDGAQAIQDPSFPIPTSSWYPALSADGRYVAFVSNAPNLVPGDTNASTDVFVHDRATGATERVSVASDGAQALPSLLAPTSSYPAISADGRYVVFAADASNLVLGDTNGELDLFVHDRISGATERVSVASDGAQADGYSFFPAISADGRYVAFWGEASNLVPADTNNTWDVFVHDRTTGTTERVSVASDGAQTIKWYAQQAAISDDGRYVAFSALAWNLVPGDTNNAHDVFVRDRATGATERVSVASDGAQANHSTWEPAISADGRQVAFLSYATNLVPGDTNAAWDVFVHDRGDPLGIVGTPSVLNVPGGVGVSGRATFSGETLAESTDPDDDGAGVVEAASLGAELTGAALIYRPAQEDVLLRLDLASLPSDPNGAGLPAILYGADLRVGQTRYEIRALRPATTATSPAYRSVALYRCAPDCTEHARLTGSFGTTGEQVLVSVPLTALGISEGTELSGLRAFTAAGEATPGALHPLDDVPLSSSLIPVSRVELGIAPASTPKDEVAFTAAADLLAGNFSGTIPTAGLSPGSYRVWTRACLGDACGPAAAAPVILGDETSPSPNPSATSTESPTPIPTESLSPSPSESPEPETTTVTFTEDSAQSGQYSDESLFEARLTDSNGDPIAGQELTFELIGAESSRSFTATTNEDGIAGVAPILNEKPGSHQLTVQFAGDEEHAGDADTVSFVVEKEDSALGLSVHGEDDDKTLRARLSDLDTSSEGIAGRTIDFYSDGALIGSHQTDADGVATVGLPPRNRGNNRTYEAVFEGDDFYIGSSDERAAKGKGGNGGGNGGSGGGGEGGRTYAGRMLLM